MTMHTAESIDQIQQKWIDHVSRRLAQGEESRLISPEQLAEFLNLLFRSVETNYPPLLRSFFDKWLDEHFQSDLQSEESNPLSTISFLFQSFYVVSRETLEVTQALDLVDAIFPPFVYSIGYVSSRLAHQKIDEATHKFEELNLTLERLDKSKSNFISVAAHELKTPLTLIEGYSMMLGENLNKDNGFEVSKPLIQGIKKGIERLCQIIDDMIDISLIDNNLLNLQFQPLWLNRILQRIIENLKEVVTARGQVIEIKQFEGDDELNYGDNERLYQALYNVISNSIKFTPDGGKILIDGRKLPGFIEIIVSDNGIGIDPTDHIRIFEKFERYGEPALHSSGKTKYKGGGPGLGLPIAKGIIQSHGGTIWVESAAYDEENCPGSSFHILLPSRKQPPDDKSAKLFGPLTEMYYPSNK